MNEDKQRASERLKRGVTGTESSTSLSPSIMSIKAELSKSIEEKMASFKKTVESNITRAISNNLQTSIAELENKLLTIFNNKFEELNNTIMNLESQIRVVNDRLDAIERQQKVCDVIINGVPALKDENLTSIYTTLCHSLSMESIPVPIQIFRTKSRIEGQDSSIIVKFNNTTEKGLLFSAVRKTIRDRGKNNKSLSLRDVGLSNGSESSAPIFVNESLSVKNYSILRVALKLKRQKQLVDVFVRSGIVYIRRKKGSTAERIMDIEKLEG